MVTVGLIASQMRSSIAAPVAFLLAMVTGGAFGLNGITLPLLEVGIALSVMALGAALLAARRLHVGVAVGLVAVAVLFHGNAHGAEAPVAAQPALYVMGFLGAAAALHVVGWTLGTAVSRRATTRTLLGAAVIGAGLGLATGVV